MKILGLSGYYHDSAACLVDNGVIVAAAQEERFTRKKHDARFPHYALEYCLEAGKCRLPEVEYVVFYDKPFLKFERLIETYLEFAPKGFASFAKSMPVWLREKLFLKKLLADELAKHDADPAIRKKLLFSEHHMSHAASAFYPSPFSDAAVLTMDGVGEWATTSTAVGSGNRLEIIKEIKFPHSLGLLYSAFTYYLGFKVNSGEYKMMGLAPYGEPKFKQKILDHLIDVKEDGSFRLDMQYFDYCTGLRMTSKRFDDLFEGPARKPESVLTQRDMDIAASVQAVTEEVVIRIGRGLRRDTGQKNLCLAGGVALNCVANGKLLRDGCFDQIWIQPAAGDAGGAVGAALAGYHLFKNQPRITNPRDSMQGSYLGPSYNDEQIESELKLAGAVYKRLTPAEMTGGTAQALADGKAIGWFQGRMEFGPRALGGRSILGDPRSPQMQSTLNLKVKYRESFRPFAPSILREEVTNYFELDHESPYMLIVADVQAGRRIPMTKEQSELFGIDKLNVPRSDLPAITHVDYSARIQTVDAVSNPQYYALLQKFKDITGCPVLINTSFNVRGEPLVCSPTDAFRCFMGTELDVLAVGNFLLFKDRQDPGLREQYHSKFDLD